MFHTVDVDFFFFLSYAVFFLSISGFSRRRDRLTNTERQISCLFDIGTAAESEK